MFEIYVCVDDDQLTVEAAFTGPHTWPHGWVSQHRSVLQLRECSIRGATERDIDQIIAQAVRETLSVRPVQATGLKTGDLDCGF